MKLCLRCKERKPLSEFNFKIKSKGTYQSHCRKCSSQYVREHYLKNKDYYLNKAYRRNTRIRNEVRQYIKEFLLSHPCVDCGENDPIVLEFDHIKDKSFNISNAGRDKTLEKIKIEISKCEVRCANCHRRKTFERAVWNKLKPL